MSHRRKTRLLLAMSLTILTMSTGCLDSEPAKRFREVFVPGLAAGLSAAVASPGDAESGLRTTWAALNEALAALFDLRTSPRTSSSVGGK